MADKAKAHGIQVVWQNRPGGHCDMDPKAIAES